MDRVVSLVSSGGERESDRQREEEREEERGSERTDEYISGRGS